MKKVNFLLIGGGVTSAIAAETLRKEGIEGSIAILGCEPLPPYHRLQLARSFLLKDQDASIIYVHPLEFYRKNNIELILGTRALSIDSKQRIVKTDKAGSIEYDKLLIATGTHSKALQVPGVDLKGVHYLKQIKDAEDIKKSMKGAKKVVIVGGTYLEIELACTFTTYGLQVINVTDVYTSFDGDLSPEINKFLVKHGVKVYLGNKIKKFIANEKGHVKKILLESGHEIECDFVVIGLGFKPNTDFLAGSDVIVDDGVVVDQYLQTNIKNIYAAGDVAKFYDPVFERTHRIESWDNAIKLGELVARNMAGFRQCYRTISYFFFNAFNHSFVVLGDTTGADVAIMRGSVEDKSFVLFYLKDNRMTAAFFMERPIAEVRAVESLIVNHIDLGSKIEHLQNENKSIEEMATQNILTLQGGGALGAFECGAIVAMEEEGIFPDIVAGISIGAFNSAIIASNPKNAGSALCSFWNELALDTPNLDDEEARRYLSSWYSIVFGSPNFYKPRWIEELYTPTEIPLTWTSFYNPAPVKKLLEKYIDFKNLKYSPVRLLVMAVNVETAEFEVFDSYTDDITVDHIMASGSLPPGFPWTKVQNKYYWDGGIVSNTPLDLTLEICGASGKKVYIVDLYPRNKFLPRNMIEVMSRKDEILFSEKIRRDMRTRDTIDNYKRIVDILIHLLDPSIVEYIKRIPLYIQTVGDPGILSVTRIGREITRDEPDARDTDFSRKTLNQHVEKGYQAAKKVLQKQKGENREEIKKNIIEKIKA